MGSLVGHYVEIDYATRFVLWTPRVGLVIADVWFGAEVMFAGGRRLLLSDSEFKPAPPMVLPIRKGVRRG